VLALQHEPDDVTPGSIRQRMEQEVCSLGLRRSSLIYNHMVVR
jgi:hypothetical protein